MESSQFSEKQSPFERMEQIEAHGATCDTFRVKLYGKLHFLKRLKPQFVNDILYQEALRKEFETGYRLEHPNLVRYITLTDDGILMEYVDGETLTQYLSNHPDYFKDRKHTDRFLRQLLDVVGYLHSHQVLHLDLKPDNILLTRIGNNVKLVDLGCSYTDSFPDTSGHTPRYAAPEQLSGGAMDERTDIYAIGKMLEDMPILPIYNKVIAKCTAQTPDARYSTVSELHDAFFPKESNRLWAFVLSLCVILILGHLFLTYRHQESVGIKERQIESSKENLPTTKSVEEQTVVPPKDNKTVVEKETTGTQNNLVIERSESSASMKGETEEEAFLEQPHQRIATDAEFERYKRKLDSYYMEVNAFLDDTVNMKRFPSHVSYAKEYQNFVHKAIEAMKADAWFFPLYNSPMNPVSSYTRNYKKTIEHKAFINGNKLP